MVFKKNRLPLYPTGTHHNATPGIVIELRMDTVLPYCSDNMVPTSVITPLLSSMYFQCGSNVVPFACVQQARSRRVIEALHADGSELLHAQH